MGKFKIKVNQYSKIRNIISKKYLSTHSNRYLSTHSNRYLSTHSNTQSFVWNKCYNGQITPFSVATVKHIQKAIQARTSVSMIIRHPTESNFYINIYNMLWFISHSFDELGKKMYAKGNARMAAKAFLCSAVAKMYQMDQKKQSYNNTDYVRHLKSATYVYRCYMIASGKIAGTITTRTAPVIVDGLLIKLPLKFADLSINFVKLKEMNKTFQLYLPFLLKFIDTIDPHIYFEYNGCVQKYFYPSHKEFKCIKRNILISASAMQSLEVTNRAIELEKFGSRILNRQGCSHNVSHMVSGMVNIASDKIVKASNVLKLLKQIPVYPHIP
jgi:hypothetical protein